MAAPSSSLRRSFTYAKCVLYGSLRGAFGGASDLRPAGYPQRGQSQVSGGAASSANTGRTSCPLAQKNETRCRGAVSPRSFSPIGPAPTRLPRIALPPAIISPPDAGACHSLRLVEQPQTDDADGPDHARDDRQPVEVPLDDRRTGKARVERSTQHRREPATLAAVQQHQHHEQQARDDEHDRQREDHGTRLVLG